MAVSTAASDHFQNARYVSWCVMHLPQALLLGIAGHVGGADKAAVQHDMGKSSCTILYQPDDDSKLADRIPFLQRRSDDYTLRAAVLLESHP
jgi:hypothetical protein